MSARALETILHELSSCLRAGIVTTALITVLGQARIFVVLGRGRLLPGWLAEIHPQRLSPQHATIVCGIASGVPWCVPACPGLQGVPQLLGCILKHR